MKKIDYRTNIFRYSLSQFRNKEGYKELCEGIAKLFLDLQKKTIELEKWTVIDRAEGEILDFIGYLFGVYRTFFDISKYFCVNAEDINKEKYFYFEKGAGNTVLTQGGLSDLEMRQRIKAAIARLYSRFTRNDNIRVIKFLTFAEKVIITKPGKNQLIVALIGDGLFITDKTFDEIESVLGDGVSLEHLTINGDIRNGDSQTN